MASNFRPPVTGDPPAPASNNVSTFAAPPPQDNLYQSGAPQHQRQDCNFDIRDILTIIFVIFGFILIILVIVFNPDVPEFRVQSLKLTNLSAVADSQHVAGNWQLRLLVVNPNKKLKISYGAMDTDLFYRSEFLAASRIPPLRQGAKNKTTVDTICSTQEAYVAPSAMSDLNSDIAEGLILFRFSVRASSVQFKYGWWQETSQDFEVWCKDLAVAFSSSNHGTAKLVGGERTCKVRL